jgi:restriction system-associated AAA family ATPase
MTAAFSSFWKSALDLYSSLHKLAMLNDLAIPRTTRKRFKEDTEKRRFASRLPEPQDEDKVFRFERVDFWSEARKQIVDYVSLSDGEHQQAQLLGTFSMVSFPDVLFLLDEPESHFNPQWRVKFISKLLDLQTPNGKRRQKSAASRQDGLLTTHAPFVPSDMKRENVLIFGKESGKIVVRRPDIETYGTTFDAILDECFDVRPPISQESRKTIGKLMKSESAEEIKKGMSQLGQSVEKAFLADRLRRVPGQTEK